MGSVCLIRRMDDRTVDKLVGLYWCLPESLMVRLDERALGHERTVDQLGWMHSHHYCDQRLHHYLWQQYNHQYFVRPAGCGCCCCNTCHRSLSCD